MANINSMQPNDIANKQVAAVSASTTAYTNGVKAVTTAPGASAAQAVNKYVNGVNASAQKWATNVAAVPLSTWINQTVTKGAPRLASGIQAALPKLQNFWNKFLPFLKTVQQQVNAMPSDTFDQRMAKMTANATALHQFSNS